jgi:asparagine synthase (glutamine-hydrolysing)
MCGIAGFLDLKEKRAEISLAAALGQRLNHRGPDDGDVYQDDRIVLVHRRLSIIDLEGSSQPIGNEDGTLQLVLNGEIYNYRELRHGLLQRGHDLKTKGDAEVILHLYEEMGCNFFHMLRGMFAFALWNASTSELLLARDFFGKKPLYYSFDGNHFAFASELKALTADPSISRDIDESALLDYLARGYVGQPKSIFRAIKKLPQGSYLLLNRDGKITIRRHWDLDFDQEPPRSYDEAKDEIRNALQESVGYRLVSDVPVGVFLSSGVDSSTVVAMMRTVTTERFFSFSIGFHESGFDEAPMAKLTAARFETEHFERYLAPEELQQFPAIAAKFDEPFSDPAAFAVYYLSELARCHCKVVLSGDGGDEIFAGYGYHRRLAGGDRLRLPAPLRSILWRFSRVVPVPQLQLYLARRGMDALQRYLVQSRHLTTDWVRRIVHPSLHDRARLEELLADDLDYFAQHSDLPLFSAVQKHDLNHTLVDRMLVKVDRMSMLHGLEVRCPFLDHKLVERAVVLPREWLCDVRSGKKMIKEIMADELPGYAILGAKRGFSIPLHDWFRGPMFGLAKEHLLGGCLASLDLFNMDEVKMTLRRHREGKQKLGEEIWMLVCFEAWAREQL